MNRRTFLFLSAGGLVTGRCLVASALEPDAGSIMTVLGPIAPGRFGRALCHEHVLVDFIGADRIGPGRYDANEVFDVVLPHLTTAWQAGTRGFVECTPAYLGRDVQLLRRLAVATGLHILTNTGYYGAAKDRYVPRHAHTETPDQLADRWTAEWARGIDGTAIRPGFIKTGVDAGPLSEIDRKLVTAAARTHRRTGLPIASHTGDTRAAMEQMAILADEHVSRDAFIWVHAQNDWSLDARVDAMRAGAWIEIDDVADDTVGTVAERLTALKQRGRLDRVLVSHDAGWYRPGEPRGGTFRGFETVERTLVPALAAAGWTADQLDQILVRNPSAAFTVRQRGR